MRKWYWWNVSRLPATVPWLAKLKFTLKFARSKLLSFTNTYWKIDNICILQIYVTVSFVWFVIHSESIFVSRNPWFICLGTKATTQATTVANTSAVLLQPSPILRICLKAVYGAVISLLLTSYQSMIVYTNLLNTLECTSCVYNAACFTLICSGEKQTEQGRTQTGCPR